MISSDNSLPEDDSRLPANKPIRRPTSPAEALEPKLAPGPMAKQTESLRRMPSMKRRGGGGFAKFIYSFFSLFLIVGIVGAVVFLFAMRSFETPGPLQRVVTIDIRPNTGLADIAEQLADENIIEDHYVFIGGIMLNKVDGKLKAGEYSIPPRASMHEIMEILVEGKALLHTITVPEGWTSYAVAKKVNEDAILNGTQVSVPPEGVLLPETYSFPRSMTKAKVIAQMRDAHTRLLDELWAKRNANLPFTTKNEAVILASIVEKETGKAEERPMVAGVFINRLRRGMRLQSDSTIIYGITKGRGPLDRSILQSDIDLSTNYNTYQIDGLPPTPIANPGAAALEATLNPLESDFLYFVADGTGGHVFAISHAEHMRNVALWRRIESGRVIKRKALE